MFQGSLELTVRAVSIFWPATGSEKSLKPQLPLVWEIKEILQGKQSSLPPWVTWNFYPFCAAPPSAWCGSQDDPLLILWMWRRPKDWPYIRLDESLTNPCQAGVVRLKLCVSIWCGEATTIDSTLSFAEEKQCENTINKANPVRVGDGNMAPSQWELTEPSLCPASSWVLFLGHLMVWPVEIRNVCMFEIAAYVWN